MKKNKILILKFLLLVLFQGGNSLQSEAQAVDTIDFPQADLTRVSQQVYPENTNPGSYITVFSKVYNAGFGIAPSNRTDYYLTADTSWTLPDKAKAYFVGSSYLSPLPSQTSILDSTGLYIPKDITAGAYFLVSYTDAGNEVYETNEFNNKYIFPINIGTSGFSIDLYPTFLSVDDSLIVSNQVIASLGESNLGIDFSGSYEVGFYLSKDSTLDNFDPLLLSKKSDGLAGNTSSYSDVKIALPPLSKGWYYLIAALDVYNSVSETQEYNNTIARRFYISGNGFADLILDSARIENPNRLNPGDSITLSFIERNIGTGSAGEHYTNFYLSTSTYIDSSAIALSKAYVAGLNPQDGIYKSEYAVIPADLASGFYYLIAQADSYNSVSESNEHNNTFTLPITIGTTDADLTTVLFDSTITVLRGDYFYANGYLSNIGSVFTSSSYMGFYLSKDSHLDSSDIFVQSKYFDYLYPNDLRYFYLSIPTYNFEPGTYYLIAKADYLNYVAESNEDNNIASVPVNIVLPSVDLSITSLFTKDTILSAGNSFYVSYSINNTGTYYASSSYTNFYLSKDSIVDEYDYLVGQSYVSYVSPGSINYYSVNSYIPSTVADGDYFLIAKADDYKNVSESNEFNNDAFIKVKVKVPSYDIAISNLTKSSEMVTVGSGIYLSYKESNLGDITFPYHYTGFVLSTDTIYNDSDINLGTYYGYDLYPGNVNYYNQYIYIPTTVPAGNYYLIVKTDSNNNTKETDENNNIAYTRIRIITPNVDLSVNTQRVNPSKAVAGNTVNVSGYLYNHGTEDSYSTNLDFYISKYENNITDSALYLGSYYSSSVYSEASVPFNQSLYLPEYLAAGDYYIVFVADGGKNQPEMNENNNIVSKKISIEAATRDLFVKSASVSSKVTVEQTVYFKATISNSGNSDVSYFNLGYYLSSDEALSPDDIFIGTLGVPGMLSKSSVPVSGEFRVPYYINQGSYKLLFVADHYKQIIETNETNNSLAKALQVINPYGDQNNEDTISEPVSSAPAIAISVVPNPVGDFINVTVQTTEASTIATFELYDNFGNKFKGGNQKITNGKFSIPASDIKTGVYLLKVVYESKVETIRIIKE
ncbi:peptidase S8/S53 subtilisin kexin sedolisin [Sporocytophaga myxococcoides]|uniref:Peptidase S8/S53 subtilisin kexin sedolisin n=1 Tax=Sporocytophaga myxococcoides TaxID=153721 RepID=A0A098LE28_9BACT|nr:CARDB domain-containing protein [Sporocytophaga myxococcoides]GAL84373.1 peptidase S8/S53 subtilisin kexin sedolisin [Sporocytophaga myxococcoides]